MGEDDFPSPLFSLCTKPNQFQAMNKSSWDTYILALRQTAREFVLSNARTLTDPQIVRILEKNGFQTNQDRVRKQRRKEGLVAESPYVRYDAPPQIEGDCVVMGDVEFPYHEHNFLNRVIELCQKWKIDQVVFNGDLFHHDSLSHFGPNLQAESNVAGLSDSAIRSLMDLADSLPTKHSDKLLETMEKIGSRVLPNPTGISEEWKYSREALKSMRQVFNKSTMLAGNHDFGRLLRMLDSPLMPEDFRRIFDGKDEWLKTGPYYYGIIYSGNQTWRATHPKNTSVIPGSIAARLADKFGTNVIQGHNHLLAMSQSPSGKYLGIEGGCMVDSKRLAYVSQRDTLRPAWVLGAVILRDGYPTLLTERWTDWDNLMGEKKQKGAGK